MDYASCKRSKRNQSPSSSRPARLSFRYLFTRALHRGARVSSNVLRSTQHSSHGLRRFLSFETPPLQGFGPLFHIPVHLVFREPEANELGRPSWDLREILNAPSRLRSLRGALDQ